MGSGLLFSSGWLDIIVEQWYKQSTIDYVFGSSAGLTCCCCPNCLNALALAATISMNYVKSILFSLLLFVITASCGSENYGDKDSMKVSTPNPPHGLEYYKNGEILFRRDCAACHGMPSMIIDGPNIFDRLFDRLPNPQESYFKKFVMDGKVLRQSGDIYQSRLEEVYRVSSMHDYRDKLTEIELEEILIYVKVTNISNEKRSY